MLLLLLKRYRILLLLVINKLCFISFMLYKIKVIMRPNIPTDFT